ncbi:hypothetical protein [Dactylosporangium darangshiense]|uniref:Uncharacterized protein n=1 Tax=Dactylosporangium darangshiense TaxID=579108 RepID=A0ABP8DU95_9ACTN
MRGLTTLACLLIPAGVACWSVWSLWRLIGGVRAGDWRRPGWFGHVPWLSLLGTAVAWLCGVLFGGSLDIAESCTYQHHQQYDAAYREAHPDGFLFPLSTKCNAGYDLVPSWVNPAIAAFFLVFVAGVAGAVWTWRARLRQRASF